MSSKIFLNQFINPRSIKILKFIHKSETFHSQNFSIKSFVHKWQCWKNCDSQFVLLGNTLLCTRLLTLSDWLWFHFLFEIYAEFKFFKIFHSCRLVVCTFCVLILFNFFSRNSTWVIIEKKKQHAAFNVSLPCLHFTGWLKFIWSPSELRLSMEIKQKRVIVTAIAWQ